MKLKDNKIYRMIIIPICVVLCFFGRFIPIPNLSGDAVGVLSIFLGSLILVFLKKINILLPLVMKSFLLL